MQTSEGRPPQANRGSKDRRGSASSPVFLIFPFEEHGRVTFGKEINNSDGGVQTKCVVGLIDKSDLSSTWRAKNRRDYLARVGRPQHVRAPQRRVSLEMRIPARLQYPRRHWFAVF